MEEQINGFSYDKSEKKINITDHRLRVTWVNVKESVGEEAGKIFMEKKDIDTFLLQNYCDRGCRLNSGMGTRRLGSERRKMGNEK